MSFYPKLPSSYFILDSQLTVINFDVLIYYSTAFARIQVLVLYFLVLELIIYIKFLILGERIDLMGIKRDKNGFNKKNSAARNTGHGRSEKPETARRLPRFSEKSDAGVICGKNPVLEALRSGRTLNKVLVAAGQEPGFLRQIRELCREKHVPFLQVERSSLAAYPDNRGVVALAAPFAYAEVEDRKSVV